MIFWGMMLFQLLAQQNYQSPRYFRGISANDIYQLTGQSDRDYTNGIRVEIGHPEFANKAAKHFLFGFKPGKGIYEDYSLAVRQNIFTPTSPFFFYFNGLDRPFAATLVVDYGRVSSNFNKAKQWESHVVLGILGPNALGAQLQNFVHKVLKNDSVHGWDGQLGTGLIFDYNIGYKQQLPFSTPISEVNWVSKASVGSFENSIQTGLEIKVGLFRDSYINSNGLYNKRYKHRVSHSDVNSFRKGRLNSLPMRFRNGKAARYISRRINRPYQIYASWKLMSRLMVYDGALQGSLIQLDRGTRGLSWDAYQHGQFFSSLDITLDYRWLQITIRKVVENDDLRIERIFGWGEFDILILF